MKFEFDHKTGMMHPKKDENIYFAKSQGGGLIIDDKKHGVRYIIERDETITRLFGSFDKDNLNFYDMRDARMISDRVIRIFGRNHKYADFHYFLKGYRVQEEVVQNCTEFLNESIWTDLQDRSSGEVVRSEVGKIIGHTPDGDRIVMSRDALASGDLVDFDGENFYMLEDRICIVVINSEGRDTYYRYDEDTDEEGVNTVKCFSASEKVRTNNDLGELKALMRESEWDDDDFDDLYIEVNRDYLQFTFGKYEFLVFDNHKFAEYTAINQKEEFLDNEEDLNSKETIERYRDILGDGFFDEESMESELRESQESYFDDLKEEEAIDLLLKYKIIEDSEDYFELDEDGNPDHSSPTFNYEDYRDEYVDKYMEGIDDIINRFLSEYGYEGIDNYIDTGKLANMIVDNDGVDRILAGADGKERECYIDGITYYIYRTH